MVGGDLKSGLWLIVCDSETSTQCKSHKRGQSPLEPLSSSLYTPPLAHVPWYIHLLDPTSRYNKGVLKLSTSPWTDYCGDLRTRG